MHSKHFMQSRWRSTVDLQDTLALREIWRLTGSLSDPRAAVTGFKSGVSPGKKARPGMVFRRNRGPIRVRKVEIWTNLQSAQVFIKIKIKSVVESAASCHQHSYQKKMREKCQIR